MDHQALIHQPWHTTFSDYDNIQKILYPWLILNPNKIYYYLILRNKTASNIYVLFNELISFYCFGKTVLFSLYSSWGGGGGALRVLVISL